MKTPQLKSTGFVISKLLTSLYKWLFEKKYLIIHNPNAGIDGRTFETKVIKESATTYTVKIPFRVFTVTWEEERIVQKNDPRIREVLTRYQLL